MQRAGRDLRRSAARAKVILWAAGVRASAAAAWAGLPADNARGRAQVNPTFGAGSSEIFVIGDTPRPALSAGSPAQAAAADARTPAAHNMTFAASGRPP